MAQPQKVENAARELLTEEDFRERIYHNSDGKINPDALVVTFIGRRRNALILIEVDQSLERYLPHIRGAMASLYYNNYELRTAPVLLNKAMFAATIELAETLNNEFSKASRRIFKPLTPYWKEVTGSVEKTPYLCISTKNVQAFLELKKSGIVSKSVSITPEKGDQVTASLDIQLKMD